MIIFLFFDPLLKVLLELNTFQIYILHLCTQASLKSSILDLFLLYFLLLMVGSIISVVEELQEAQALSSRFIATKLSAFIANNYNSEFFPDCY